VIKRLFDFVLSFLGLLTLSPVLFAAAVWIKLSSRGPVFYRGVRVGRYGKNFRVFKFRTMVLNADKIGGPSTSEDDPRVTQVGRFIRRYKIDELPQLLNVVKGEMSLVGPRPEVPSEVELYTKEERGLLSVTPGITDWASIRFRNEGEILKGSSNPHLTYQEKIRPEKIRLALEYTRSRSFWIDFKIILATLWGIIGGNPDALAEMPRIPSLPLGRVKGQDLS
jgi:lipopolysaccharide/colanic/teichoic acid biosynthesis glycosyltransferase